MEPQSGNFFREDKLAKFIDVRTQFFASTYENHCGRIIAGLEPMIL